MTPNRFARITVAIDGSAHSEEALDAAIDLTQRYGSELTILSVAPLVPVYMPSGNAYLAAPVAQTDTAPYRALVEAAVKRAREAGVSAVTGACPDGVVIDEILAFLDAHPADLVVVGSRGMSAAKRLLIGSISSALVAHAPCPVLVVRGGRSTKPADGR
ncbi:MAG TPA: universal stress protein [Thermoplasmata archaeon]|jgi:nucleotide-binding universal stress UspA family protein|nr:universal stress protein [Thermoplasmata archaeon]